jgi:hypothetical protein
MNIDAVLQRTPSAVPAQVSNEIEKSLLDIDFASLTRRTFTPSPAAWEDQILYFLLLDRFSDGREKDGCRDNRSMWLGPRSP